jgi:predicted HicB family RNase H-like nuclease
MANKKGEAMLIELSGQMLERFNVVKKHYGETESTEVVRRLICETYDKMQGKGKKLLIASSVYENLQTRAKTQGLSVDEYVDKIIHDRTEQGAYAQGLIDEE